MHRIGAVVAIYEQLFAIPSRISIAAALVLDQWPLGSISWLHVQFWSTLSATVRFVQLLDVARGGTSIEWKSGLLKMAKKRVTRPSSFGKGSIRFGRSLSRSP